MTDAQCASLGDLDHALCAVEVALCDQIVLYPTWRMPVVNKHNCVPTKVESLEYVIVSVFIQLFTAKTVLPGGAENVKTMSRFCP